MGDTTPELRTRPPGSRRERRSEERESREAARGGWLCVMSTREGQTDLSGWCVGVCTRTCAVCTRTCVVCVPACEPPRAGQAANYGMTSGRSVVWMAST